MNPKEQEAIAEIGRKYCVAATPEENGVRLEFDGIVERFTIYWLNDEFILGAKTWHEHFASITEVINFLGGLFSGQIQVVVKFRGKTSVGHQVQVLKDGETKVVSTVGSLVPLFWRKKTYKTMEYKTADQSSDFTVRGLSEKSA